MTKTRRTQRGAWSRPLTSLVVGLFAAFAGIGPPARAADISVHAQLLPPSIRVGESATLSIEVSGAQDVPPPALSAPDGVHIDYVGPATQVTIINGRVQASVQHRYSVTASKPGTYHLGPFAILYGGRRYEAEAVTLSVGAASSTASLPGGGALRLVLRVPRTQLYVREKVPVEVLLYVGAVRAGDLQYPTLVADGFALDRFQEPAQYQEQLEGQTYTVVRFSSSLVPLRAGRLRLGPASTRLNVYERRRGGFFDDPFFSQRRPVSLESETVELEVLPLPEEGKPKNFTGAVGRFSLDVAASPTEVRVGDPLTLRIVLRGEGNLDGVPPPALPESPQWRTYEPHPVSGEGGALAFEQVVIPATAIDALPPIEFVYFDPELQRYERKRSAPIALTVRPRADTPAAMVAAPTPPGVETLGRDIVYLKEQPGRWIRLQESASPAVVAGHAGLLLLPLASYLFDRRRRRVQTAAFAQRKAATEVAHRTLRQCEQALSQNDPQQFYESVAACLREYLPLRFGLPPGRVDENTVNELPTDVELRADIATLLRACEEARFGKQAAMGAPQQHWQVLQRVLRKSEGLERSKWLPRLVLAVPALCLAGRCFAAPSGDALFFQGNGAYAAQDFKAAIVHYEAALAQGVASANLFFNLGNAHFKAGNLGKAILNYERAHRLAPRDADIQANLEFARSEAHAPACPRPTWEALLFPLVGRVSPSTLRVTTSLLYGLALVAWSLAFVHVAWRQRWGIAAIVAGVAFVVAGANFLWLEYGRPWTREAIILEATVARFAPEAEATEHFRLAVGASVRVREQRDRWWLVERCDGRRGWVPAGHVEPLSPSVTAKSNFTAGSGQPS